MKSRAMLGDWPRPISKIDDGAQSPTERELQIILANVRQPDRRTRIFPRLVVDSGQRVALLHATQRGEPHHLQSS